MLRVGLNYGSRSLRTASQRRVATNKAVNTVATREFHIPASWNRWFNVPKGFEKFFRRGGSTKAESGAREKVDPKFTSGDKSRKAGGGSTGSDKKPEDENNTAKIVAALGLLGLSTALLADDLKNGRYVYLHEVSIRAVVIWCYRLFVFL